MSFGLSQDKKVLDTNLQIQFTVECDWTKPGQVIKLTGSSPRLGNWNPSYGFTMHTSASDFPNWKSEPHFSVVDLIKGMSNPHLEYKYVIVGDSSNPNFQPVWENIDGNRVLNLLAMPTDGSNIIKRTEKFGSYQKPKPMITYGPQPDISTLYGQFYGQNGAKEDRSGSFSSLHSGYAHQSPYSVSPQQSALQGHFNTGYMQPGLISYQPNYFGPVVLPPQHFQGNQTTLIKTQSAPPLHQKVSQGGQNEPKPDQSNSPMRSQSTVQENQSSASKKAQKPAINVRAFTKTGSLDIYQNLHKVEGDVPSQPPLERIDSDQSNASSTKDKLIVVTFKLPLIIEKVNGKWSIKRSRSILNQHLFELQQRNPLMRSHWIGWPGIFVDEQEQDQIRKLLVPYNCTPVFHKKKQVQDFLIFHEHVLKPLFHNFKSLNIKQDFDESALWNAYNVFNMAYVDPIMSVYTDDKDLIWIHDTYLMLLCQHIRKKQINGRIGFSLHAPFPSSDIYKMFQYRKIILKSLLCCDLISFHIFTYARHFYTSCQRLLGLNHSYMQGGRLGIEYYGRTVMLRISHIGVEVALINKAVKEFESPVPKAQLKTSAQRFREELIEKLAGRSEVFGSYDRSQRISGLRNKLVAYKKFLEEYPRTRTMCCLVQYLIPFECLMCEDPYCSHFGNSEDTREYESLAAEIENKFPGSVITVKKNLDLDQRLALWSVTKNLLITTLIDGQCIPPLEFIAVKAQQGKFRQSTAIISENSGNTTALGGVLKVNPSNVEEITKAMDLSLQMSEDEKEQRLQISYNYVKDHSTLKWASAFLRELKRSADAQTSATDDKQLIFTGDKLNRILMKQQIDFKNINMSNILQDVRAATNRLIIVNEEGVVPTDKEGMRRACTVFDKLSSQPGFNVVLISSRTKKEIEQSYGEKAANLCLAAESGFYYKLHQTVVEDQSEWHPNRSRPVCPVNSWEELLRVPDKSWIESVNAIMQSFEEKTDGSRVIEREQTITWDYRDTDDEFGNYQAKELKSYLQHIFQPLQIVDIIQGKKCIQVFPKQLKRTEFVKMLFRKLGRQDPIDFVLYIGEESINEQAFSFLNALDRDTESLKQFISKECPIFTCTVGQKFTKAKYYLDQNKDEITSILKQLLFKPTVNRLDLTRKTQSMATIPHYSGFGFNKPQTGNAKAKPIVAEGSSIQGQNASPSFQEPGLPYNIGSPETDKKVLNSFYEPSYNQNVNQQKLLKQVQSHRSKFSSDGDGSQTDSYDNIPLDI